MQVSHLKFQNGPEYNLKFIPRLYLHWNGGRHPVGMVSLGCSGGGNLPNDFSFDEPKSDEFLRYQGPE